MSRLREDARPAGRRLEWGTATVAAVALIALAALVTMKEAPAPESDAPAAQRSIVVAPEVLPDAPAALVKGPPVAPKMTLQGAARATRETVAAPVVDDLLDSILPIETEPILLQPLEVAPLTSATTSIDLIEIPPLTIEPLSASND